MSIHYPLHTLPVSINFVKYGTIYDLNKNSTVAWDRQGHFQENVVLKVG